MIAPGSFVGVTGASGFIGRHLCADLRAAGLRPVAIGRGPEAERQTDYSPESLRAALAGCAAVVHLAGRRMTREDAPMELAPFLGPNVEATGHLARAAQAEGVERIVFASTIAVYSAASPAPWREDGPVHPVNAYALSKLMAEHYLEMLARARQAPPALSLRFAAVYGHGEKGTPALMKFVNQAAAGETITLSGNPDYTIDQLYVTDATAAILAALSVSAPLSGACNIGGGRAWTVAEIARTANAVFGNDGNLDDSATTPGQAHQAVMDLAQANRILGWQPAHDLQAGLADLRRRREEGGRGE
ncbi:NAD-dependent epimerase/dehydratase family protein [Paracoccus denitrificans]|jgi:UDP-glucose 4-epimerase|uniref:NAD-dependent epimerase/dehydratase n=1 Tax=Paracoccus denitrificans (strain Pd 1222) TaxID=318586 RepID=A1B7X9_PARDP|nr:NAD(P)-dependent oxidoreductase [Paracoccus denitrificans]ABL71623.1 NAD-dependent epimerase/dehydratase [Paracoccus denitrificans PD1222]MBB4630273.1 UDP-glucose 4-epimerase [Paracoccus denitrificans]MCU7431635.1 NAD(P)-dependent oxidoreductase [Paracoccus denitrificans]QAR28216.1 NAD(P)-dependent oxidoreductase [Paracoccus denitrificans]UPV97952.1 NAD(P)-dependent oxidoreductase [Paracoccus denitrificans]